MFNWVGKLFLLNAEKHRQHFPPEEEWVCRDDSSSRHQLPSLMLGEDSIDWIKMKKDLFTAKAKAAYL